MKALVKKEAAPGLWLENLPEPTPGDHDVIVKVQQAAICGTDVHIYKWDEWAQQTIPVGLTIGHEFMGEVVERGAHAHTVELGQRVSVEGHLYCRNCRNCHQGREHLCIEMKGIGINVDGGFAEYVKVPARNIFKLPDTIPNHIAAVSDPLGNAVHTVLSLDIVGEDVLITGAGPIGCMAAAICRKIGARHVVITDLNDKRLELAQKMGASHTVNVGRESLRDVMDDLGLNGGFTAALEMSGAPAALETIVDVCMPDAQVSLLGILPKGAGIDWPTMIFKGLKFNGIYGRQIFVTWYKMIHLLESGLDIEPLITHRFSIDQFEKGFAAMISGESGKVILEVAE